MNWDVAFAAISTYFSSAVTIGLSLATQFDNGPMPMVGDDDTWVRLTTLPSSGAQVGFGDGGRFRTNGLVIVQVFTPIAQGDGTVLATATAIAKLFLNKAISPVQFRTPQIKVVGRSDNFWQVNIEMPFYHDYLP